MKVDSLIVLDEIVYSGLKKYIWYGDLPEQEKDGEELFRYLLQNKIYVDGFASNSKSFAGSVKFCKPVVDINDLEKADSLVFIAKEYGDYLERGANKDSVSNESCGEYETGSYLGNR